MIERIFIPTVNRVNEQITFYALPKLLKNRVTMVVQEWEYLQYYYDCDYLILPEEINLNDYLCLAKTRKLIYETGKNTKYCVLDDDLVFKRRNQKYFGLESDMDKSKRVCTEKDILEMFDLYDKWLDDVTFCGGHRSGLPPATKEFRDNGPVFSQIFINGADIYDKLSGLPLTEVRYDEDVLFILSLLSNGFCSRESNRFGFDNLSLSGKVKDTLQLVDETTYANVWKDHNKIQELYPDYYKVLLDDNGNRIKGGFRNYGKTRTAWAKCFASSQRQE
jgi:hypothetical protein